MRVVLNADDFGASDDTVEATIDCFERGLLTSATIMAAMPATERALRWASAHPELSFGVHLTFTGGLGERLVSDPVAVPSLVDGAGGPLPPNELRARALTRRLSVQEIAREAAAQIELVRGTVAVSHVDSHRHVHKLAPFRAALEDVLPGLGIARVRRAQNVYVAPRRTSPTYWLGGAWGRRTASAFRTTDHFFMAGKDETGWGARLAGLADGLPGSTLEIGVHPGREEAWRASEAAELAAAARLLRDGGHELVGWDSI